MQHSAFPPIHALAINVSTPGLWRAANYHLNTLRAGPEVPEQVKAQSTSGTVPRPGEMNLFRDIPELVLMSVLQLLDDISLTSIAQTCRYAHSLASKPQLFL